MSILAGWSRDGGRMSQTQTFLLSGLYYVMFERVVA